MLAPLDRRVRPEALGYRLSAYVTVQVVQRSLADVSAALEHIPEVVEVTGLSGVADLLVEVVARDADDLWRITEQVLAIPGCSAPTPPWPCAASSSTASARCWSGRPAGPPATDLGDRVLRARGHQQLITTSSHGPPRGAVVSAGGAPGRGRAPCSRRRPPRPGSPRPCRPPPAGRLPRGRRA
ncbi:Lrp/AsnC family transcriptional regulator [Blastococcus brunescens]|uniref:Lrp/AsnC family transcriptional regulator n=1 Tax=Blastococcus brunescens TaxID=1564165 RepID=A0ABZ1B8Q3_9ACTN|nr:Lrp/AsnC family transcriptional regulator [Blastococcus sp. BMG 8361]WRL67192.1 Lrp/AsnC family transcriptional regulator [Blastococcus sp. BMG 8361]